jgi:multidrug efflux pump subunit AcrB
MLGITNYDVQRQINMALYGSSPTIYRKDGQEYNVILKTDIETPTQLENLNIKSNFTQTKVPLRQYADLNYSTKIDTINRYNESLACTIFADPLPGYNPTQLTNEIETALKDIDTESVSIEFDGERENIKENFGVLGILALMAIFLIYLILVVQFKSFIQPLVILATIPLSLIGSILGLFLFQQPMSLTALLGIIALIGLVVKNGILLIEYINDALLDGLLVENACIDAVDKRFNSIILSAMTTIMGLFPLAISGNSLFAPMAISLMAGLLVSTVLTMVVVPVIFTSISKITK